MGKIIIAAVLVTSAALAFADPATTNPTTAPATQPASQDTSTEAISLDAAIQSYRAGKFDESSKLAAVVSKTFKRKAPPLTDQLLIDSLHLQLVCQLKLSRHPTAAEFANQLFLNASMDRAMLLNVSACDIRQRSYVIRSAKALRDFAIAHPTDEDVVNQWGVALATMSKQAKPAAMEELESAYMSVDAQLESTKPGMKRWGSRWVSADEFRKLDESRQSALRECENKASQIEDARKSVQEASENAQAAREDAMQSRRSEAQGKQARLREAERRLQEANAYLEKAIKAHARAKELIPKPTWLPPAGPFEPDFLK